MKPCDHTKPCLLKSKGIYECLHCNLRPKSVTIQGVSSRGPCDHNSISYDTYANEPRCNWCNCTAIVVWPEPKPAKPKRGKLA